MKITEQVSIDAPIEEVWQAITNFDDLASRISGIEKVEILERPDDGLVGLKWRETRIMFGKEATETMWITAAAENDCYETEAQSHGSLYRSRHYVADQGGTTELGMEFSAKPLTLGAKIMYFTMGFMFKGATEKALAKDLQDIKNAVENGGGS